MGLGFSSVLPCRKADASVVIRVAIVPVEVSPTIIRVDARDDRAAAHSLFATYFEQPNVREHKVF
ncbi:hypothetical protein IPO96_02635 [Candidatus Saccharibacteria bacterium]|jgi:hypothetical protein|nr:MAG: hypothetical protein IPO96_02635 [Candidatus Saccharibacteria bacterium]